MAGVSTSCSPCFCGTPCASLHALTLNTFREKLQSVFLWNPLCKVEKAVEYLNSDHRLQSVFLWNPLCKVQNQKDMGGGDHSCSPCFCGTPCARYRGQHNAGRLSRVAVRVFVEPLVQANKRMLTEKYINCCSPCFCGTPCARLTTI